MNDRKPELDDILTLHGIRPTAVRILVCKAMAGFHDTFSMNDLEEVLDSVDKSTLFRTLTLFAEHHLVHVIEDGSGSTKYCMCRNDHACSVEELHCHFYCEACHKTFCLDHTHIPAVRYPAGFEVRQVDYLLKGRCAACRNKRHE
ncbi:MAG TPA: transcriptional repressor [Candidatus Tidjanibacter gallistercoris]|nr:transcriptional repressor [Candidatus Tidjanibacter gallistercoris]